MIRFNPASGVLPKSEGNWQNFVSDLKAVLFDALTIREIGTFIDGDTTPSVGGRTDYETANTAPTSITTFDDGRNGQSVQIFAGDANTTFVDGSTLQLDSGANYSPTANSIIKFVLRSGVWYEVRRQVQ